MGDLFSGESLGPAKEKLHPMFQTISMRLEILYARYARVNFNALSDCMTLLTLVQQEKMDLQGAIDTIKIRMNMARDKAMPRARDKIHLECLKRGSRRKLGTKTIGPDPMAFQKSEQYTAEYAKWIEEQRNNLPRDD